MIDSLRLIYMAGGAYHTIDPLRKLMISKHNIVHTFCKSPKPSGRGNKIIANPLQIFLQQKNLSYSMPESIRSKEEIEKIKYLKPDLIIVFSYGNILPEEILNIPKWGCINIHASLLPKWRGAAPIQRAIMEGDDETGISIMQIISELDAGPYMLQEKIKIDKKDNYISLSKKLCNLGSKLILRSLKLIEQNNYKFIEQNKKNISYAKKINKKESEIDWSLPANNIIAKINGLNPFPGVWFLHKGVRFKIVEAIEVDQSGQIGEVLDNNLTVACKQKAIRVLLIQREGKKILKTKDFLAGYKIQNGEKLA